MKLYLSASAIVLGLTVGAAFAVEQPKLPNGNPSAQNAAPQKTPQQIARERETHQKVLEAADTAKRRGDEATAALCTQDKDLQERTRQTAQRAAERLREAALDEAFSRSDVKKANEEAEKASKAKPYNKAEDDKKDKEYRDLWNARATEIADAALAEVSAPQKAACPPPQGGNANPPQEAKGTDYLDPKYVEPPPLPKGSQFGQPKQAEPPKDATKDAQSGVPTSCGDTDDAGVLLALGCLDEPQRLTVGATGTPLVPTIVPGEPSADCLKDPFCRERERREDAARDRAFPNLPFPGADIRGPAVPIPSPAGGVPGLGGR